MQAADPDSVVLGAGSNLASIVIKRGAPNQAGSVAIGDHSDVGATTRSVAIGPYTSAAANNAVVIGTGIDDRHKLASGAGVSLGAGSNLASIVIKPGAPDQAGSVAIGPYTTAGMNVNNAVVIGSGLNGDVLRATDPNSVVLGAGSNLASIVITPGAKGQAGSVAIGPYTTAAANVNNAVVVGSGRQEKRSAKDAAQRRRRHRRDCACRLR